MCICSCLCKESHFLDVVHPFWPLQTFCLFFHIISWNLRVGFDGDIPESLILYISSGCGSVYLFPSDTEGSIYDNGWTRHWSMNIAGYCPESFFTTFFFLFYTSVNLFYPGFLGYPVSGSWLSKQCWVWVLPCKVGLKSNQVWFFTPTSFVLPLPSINWRQYTIVDKGLVVIFVSTFLSLMCGQYVPVPKMLEGRGKGTSSRSHIQWVMWVFPLAKEPCLTVCREKPIILYR